MVTVIEWEIGWRTVFALCGNLVVVTSKSYNIVDIVRKVWSLCKQLEKGWILGNCIPKAADFLWEFVPYIEGEAKILGFCQQKIYSNFNFRFSFGGPGDFELAMWQGPWLLYYYIRHGFTSCWTINPSGRHFRNWCNSFRDSYLCCSVILWSSCWQIEAE